MVTKSRRWSVQLNEVDEDLIKAYLKGAIYAHCNASKGNFCAADFAGKKNYYWYDTPLQKIWEKYYSSSSDEAYSYSQAGKDVGCFLKRILIEDKRRIFQKCKEERFNGGNYYKFVEDISDCQHG